jgi:hypothetical protein
MTTYKIRLKDGSYLKSETSIYNKYRYFTSKKWADYTAKKVGGTVEIVLPKKK